MTPAPTNTPQSPGLVIRIPPPIWALILLLISWVIARAFDLPVILRSDAGAAVMAIAGFALAAWGGRTFTRAGTELEPASQTNKKLVSNGPFHYTRNPMYSGVVLVMLGIALFFGTVPFFVSIVAFFLIVNGLFVPFEEAKMERQFGAGFREYKSRVRRWGIW